MNSIEINRKLAQKTLSIEEGDEMRMIKKR